jgi:hypothetical protein
MRPQGVEHAVVGEHQLALHGAHRSILNVGSGIEKLAVVGFFDESEQDAERSSLPGERLQTGIIGAHGDFGDHAFDQVSGQR